MAKLRKSFPKSIFSSLFFSKARIVKLPFLLRFMLLLIGSSIRDKVEKELLHKAVEQPKVDAAAIILYVSAKASRCLSKSCRAESEDELSFKNPFEKFNATFNSSSDGIAIPYLANL